MRERSVSGLYRIATMDSFADCAGGQGRRQARITPVGRPSSLSTPRTTAFALRFAISDNWLLRCVSVLLVNHSSRPTRLTDTQTHEHVRAKEAAKLKETTRQKNKRKEKLGQAKFTVKDAREYRRESPWALLLRGLSFVLFDVLLVTDCGVKRIRNRCPDIWQGGQR